MKQEHFWTGIKYFIHEKMWKIHGTQQKMAKNAQKIKKPKKNPQTLLNQRKFWTKKIKKLWKFKMNAKKSKKNLKKKFHISLFSLRPNGKQF